MKKRILILDDDADILDILAYLLTDDGYEIQSDMYGDNIWDSIRSFKPDLILMDLMLADLDGRSICRAIKENSETKDIAVIMISARSDLRPVMGITGSPDEFISKPFDIDNVLNKIRALVNN